MTDSTSNAYPAGWYADTNAPGTERYYDGNAWTMHTRPVVAAPTVPITTTDPVAPAAKAAWYKRKGIIIPVGIVAGLIVIGSIGGALSGGKRDAAPVADATRIAVEPAEETAAVTVPETTGLTAKEAEALLENAGLKAEFSADEGIVIDRDNWTVLSTTPAAGATAKAGNTVVVNVQKKVKEAAAPAAPSATSAPPAPQKPAMTTAQSSAVRSAQSYLSYSGFSRAGLIEQLTSAYGEGFTPEDAEFAVAYLESAGAVDWNVEAQQSAESYLKFQGFSRDGLFEQLTSEYGEKFTPDQANYALAAVGL